MKKEKNRPDVRLTVDTKKDYERACFILKSMGKRYVTTELAIKYGEEFELKGEKGEA